MKKVRSLTILIACIIVCTSCIKESKVFLFNGEDLDNWDKIVFDSIADPDEVFQVREGIMWLSGNPFGYITTRDTYSNYKLHVEWRWPGEPTNSGVFLHVQELNPAEFPLCIEAQLKHENAGDFVLIGHGSGLSTPDTSFIIEPDEGRFKLVKRFSETSEHPAGEWNVYEITCKGDSLKLIVNDILQNEGVEATLTSGRIALQSEGGPIEFRNIYLIPTGE